MNNYRVRFDYYNYEKHIEKILRWADAKVTGDKRYEICQWIYKNSTLYMKIKKNMVDWKNKNSIIF